jgi:hypothetical protein
MADIEPCLRRGEPRRSKKVAVAGLGIEDYGACCRSKEFVYHAANGGFETANSGALLCFWPFSATRDESGGSRFYKAACESYNSQAGRFPFGSELFGSKR